MSNMSYCRFQNTRTDLDDCAEHITDNLCDKSEIEARRELVACCIEICQRVGFSIIEGGAEIGPANIDGRIQDVLNYYEHPEQQEED